MSGIAGIYNLDGTPAERSLLQRMSDKLAHRGPDDSGCWIDGPVGMVHRMLHTTPESLQEVQPLRDETGTLCLTLDGRVDNREELRAALEDKDVTLHTDTDAELVLRSYQCWGKECPQKLIGDFAFVIWDQHNQQLFCARDFLGIKPFYYYTDGRKFLWASELRPLFEDTTIRREPNEGMIGEYLASAITDNEETLYRGIVRLSPAHCLTVRPGQFRKARYWDIDTTRRILYRSDSEYAQHFRSIFKEAVQCRLRSHRPIAADLSGGLDSSSVVSMAQSLYRDRIVAGARFETCSLIFPGLPCDESSYIEDVTRKWGLTSNTLCVQNFDPQRALQQIGRYQDIPDYPNDATAYPLKTWLQEKDCRVVLTGTGGDEWFEGSYLRYADLLRGFKLMTLFRQMRADSSFHWPILAMRFGLWPLFPKAVRRAIRSILKRGGVPPWIKKEFSRRNRLSERLSQEIEEQSFSSLSQRQLFASTSSGWQTHFLEMGDRLASSFELEERHPFEDRRIVEFALAIPEEQRWRGQHTKFVLRQAMQDLLPESVRQRLTKADFSYTFPVALALLGGDRFFEALAIESMGWVDGNCVRRIYRQMADRYAMGDEGYIALTWPLWMIVVIDLWFKAVFIRNKPVEEDELAFRPALTNVI